MRKILAVAVVSLVGFGNVPVLAAQCAAYSAPDGSLFQFLAADDQSGDQAVLVRLPGGSSHICVYTAEDEYGGGIVCPDRTDQVGTPANDPNGIEAFGKVFARNCAAAVKGVGL